MNELNVATINVNYDDKNDYLKRDVFERLNDYKYYTGASRYRFDELGNGKGKAGRYDLYIDSGWAPSNKRPFNVFSSVIKIPRAPVVEPGTLGVQKFGVQAITPKMIWVYRNGDPYDKGKPFFIKTYYKTLAQLYKKIGDDCRLYAGPCRRIYDRNLNMVTHISEFIDGAKYLATSGEPPAPKERVENFLSPYIIQ